MMRTLAVLIMLGVTAFGQTDALPYLKSTGLPVLDSVLPAAPKAGDPQDVLDRAIFLRTRALDGTPRWLAARADNDLSVAALLADFQCPLGIGVSPTLTPKLAHLVAGITAIAGAAVGPIKTKYQRKRPFLVDAGPVCLADVKALATSFDYPSGHASISWALGLVLAEMAPSHASAILTRARAFGDSRLVCGVHNASAVAGGRLAAAAVVAALHTDPEFEKDLKAAAAELTAASNGKKPDNQVCATEMQTFQTGPFDAIPAKNNKN